MNTATRAYQGVSAQQRRDELILEHLALVRHVIGRLTAYLPAGVDVENLEAAGTLGLVEAAGRFDPTQGASFETFASWRIRGAILDELRRNCPLPQHQLEKIQRIRSVYRDVPAPVSVDVLAQKTGLSPDEVADCLTSMRMTRMMSLDAQPDVRLANLAVQQECPEHLADLEDQKRLLTQAIAGLPERERLVVTLYYLEDLRLKEIGQLLSLSESRVSRLLNATLFQLGETLRAALGTDEA